MQDSISEIRDTLIGETGVLAQLRLQGADIANVKFLIAGGIDPATGEPKLGIGQKLDQHLATHAQEQRNHQTNKRLVIGAVLGIFVTVISGVLLNWWLHLFGP